jgi:ribose transport system permease protein
MNFIQMVWKFLGRISKQREFFIIIAVIVVFIVMTFINNIFFTPANMKALFLGIATELIMAVGMTIVMIAGGFDMSVASNLAFSGAVAALAAKAGVSPILAMIIGVAVGASIGAFNGFFISYLEMAPFVITLAARNIFRGFLVAMCKGRSITKLPAFFNAIGQKGFLNVQYPVWFAILFLLIGHFLLQKTRFFRQCYYIGGNEKAANMSGIKVKQVKMLYYMILGALAGFAGVLTIARFGSASTTTAEGLEMKVITAVIIGGASMTGGAGTIIGTFFGSVLMTTITNIIMLQGYDVYWQTFITGATLFVAVLLDQLTIINRKKREQIYSEKLLRRK